MSEIKRIFVKPSRPGLIVRRPDKGYTIIPDEGDFVPAEGPHWIYYFKRLKEGSLVETKPQKKAKPQAAALEG